MYSFIQFIYYNINVYSCRHTNTVIDFVYSSPGSGCSVLSGYRVRCLSSIRAFQRYNEANVLFISPISTFSSIIIFIITFIKMPRATWILAIRTHWEYRMHFQCHGTFILFRWLGVGVVFGEIRRFRIGIILLLL